MKEYFDFLLFYLVALLVGGLGITGWYTITRGHWETCPDGTKKFVGKIFKGWLKFWERTHGFITIYYEGKELQRVLMHIEPLLGITTIQKAEHSYALAPDKKSFFVNSKTADLLMMRGFIVELQQEIKFHYRMREDGFDVMISKNFEDYVFPEYIRSPMASCIYCFSSVYGTLAWFFIVLVGKTYFWVLFSSDAVYFIFWPIYCFSLSFVLPWLNKKI